MCGEYGGWGAAAKARAGRSAALSWHAAGARTTLCPIDTANSVTDGRDDASRSENGAMRRGRVAREAVLIAQTRASAAAGRTMSEQQVDAWINGIGANDEPR